MVVGITSYVYEIAQYYYCDGVALRFDDKPSLCRRTGSTAHTGHDLFHTDFLVLVAKTRTYRQPVRVPHTERICSWSFGLGFNKRGGVLWRKGFNTC